MIYFDASYIAKCYLNEPGADRVRELAYGADGLASCELARLEFAAILKRHVREGHVSRRERMAILTDFEEDERNGVWQWLERFPMTCSEGAVKDLGFRKLGLERA